MQDNLYLIVYHYRNQTESFHSDNASTQNYTNNLTNYLSKAVEIIVSLCNREEVYYNSADSMHLSAFNHLKDLFKGDRFGSCQKLAWTLNTNPYAFGKVIVSSEVT
jgi:glutamyl-tRNA reductase